MHIHFERSGGFMGLHMAYTIDTAQMSAEEADRLREMLVAADFFALPTALLPKEQTADQFRYVVRVEDAQLQHTVETTETAATAELRLLLRRLTILARSQTRQTTRQTPKRV